jgi:phosphatidylethanolamine-binding protein (PEBP) family uncharacterized protein
MNTSVMNTSGPAVEPAPGVFTLSSPSLLNATGCSAANPDPCSIFPQENTSYMGNLNVSPELTWTGAPMGTASFALEFTDLTFGQPFWAIWNIPGDVTTLPAGIPPDSATIPTPAGATQTNATFAEGFGYLGPQAPCNVYEFVLYALSVATFSPTQPEYVALVGDELEALGDRILGRATLSARNDVVGECD